VIALLQNHPHEHTTTAGVALRRENFFNEHRQRQEKSWKNKAAQCHQKAVGLRCFAIKSTNTGEPADA